ncbi:MAG: tRNA lysidine(34) synthetase TilS [Candidatus Omnitrophota bacterium]
MFVEKVKSAIKKFKLLKAGDKIVVAVSGGSDSTALLFALNALKKEYDLELYIAHLNHKFRRADQTKKDYDYVSALARRLDLPLIFKEIDVPGYARQKRLSLEEAARDKRYEFLLDAATRTGANKIAVGHTLDDQAETVLMRLIRGSGLSGLRGIFPARDLNGVSVIRPLIQTWKADIKIYLKEIKVRPRRDATNFMPVFLRNRVRLRLLPLLEKYNPRIKDVLVRSAINFSYDYEALSEAVNREFKRSALIKKDSIEIRLRRLERESPGLKRGVFRKAIELLKGDLRGIENSHIEDIEALSVADKGALDIPAKIRIRKAKGNIIFERVALLRAPVSRLISQLSAPGKTPIPELGVLFTAAFVKSAVKAKKPKSVEYVDYDKLRLPLRIRLWEKGDRFKPLGMKEEKKLQDFYVDEKIERSQRGRIPLVVSGEDIIWVCGLRLSDEVKITPRTRRVLKLSCEKMS